MHWGSLNRPGLILWYLVFGMNSLGMNSLGYQTTVYRLASGYSYFCFGDVKMGFTSNSNSRVPNHIITWVLGLNRVTRHRDQYILDRMDPPVFCWGAWWIDHRSWEYISSLVLHTPPPHSPTPPPRGLLESSGSRHLRFCGYVAEWIAVQLGEGWNGRSRFLVGWCWQVLSCPHKVVTCGGGGVSGFLDASY